MARVSDRFRATLAGLPISESMTTVETSGNEPQRTDGGLRPILAFIGIAVIACVAYWPGLRGPFVLDDFGSLAALGNLGGVTDWESFKAFVFGGFTGPGGRPLALATFLIDGTNWPTDPWPFKRTNLVIHVLCGGMLAVVTNQVLRLVRDERSARWLALFCASVWLLHPFLVSTTLYPVQRMAQLATLFVFAGLSLYVYGRRQLPENPRRGYILMSAAILVFTPLATLCKENGFLLPLLIGALEFSVLSSVRERYRSPSAAWTAAFIGLPTLLLFAAMARYGLREDFFVPIPPRHYSPYERLLTESRILVDYLAHWFLPKIYTAGIFQDHFPVSRGVLSPATTLASMLFHAVALTAAFGLRRRLPLMAFGILFFYAGHLLESTILNLELYFEHRNYLPAAFLALIPAVLLERFVHSGRALAAAAVLSLVVLAAFTNYSARIWQTYPSIVEASAQIAPTSARAQQQYSMLLFNAGQHDRALDVVRRAIDAAEVSESLRLWESVMLCENGALTKPAFHRMQQAVAARPYDLRSLNNYELLISQVIEGKCPAISLHDLRGFFEELLTLDVNGDPAKPMFAQLAFFLGLVDMKTGEVGQAMGKFLESLDSRPGAGRAMHMAAMLATDSHYDEARRLALRALEYKDQEANGEIRKTSVRVEDIEDFLSNVAEASRPASAAPRQ